MASVKTDGNVREEDSPGNYTVHKTSAGIVLRTYDLAGFATDTVVGGPPSGE